MSKSIYQIEGFDQLQQKIKQLPDKVKKREVLKILGQAANPTVKAARSQAPVSKQTHWQAGKRTKKLIQPGNLRKSIGKIRGKRGSAKVNAVLYVGPRSKGRKNDGWYGAMVHDGHNVYRKGFSRKNRKAGSTKRYSSQAIKFVKANPFMDRAYNQTKGLVTQDSEKRIAKYLNKQIQRLSDKGF